MANQRITDLTEKTPTSEFWIEVVDPNDTTESSEGSSFKSKLPISSVPSFQDTLNVSEIGDKLILGGEETIDFIGAITSYPIDAQEILDSKIYVSGAFNNVNGVTTNRLVRLNSDGSTDASFNIGTGFNSFVKRLKLQADGKILCGGDFTTYKGVSQNRLIRLNSDGSTDASFNIGTGFNLRINEIVPLLDGKILIGGQFTNFNGTARTRIIKLNSDGTEDVSFTAESGFNISVTKMAVQSDGKIVVIGEFTTYKGSTANRIIRLNADGSKDTSFDYGTGFNDFADAIYLQSDGKIVVGGNFTTYQGSTANRIIRLNADGSKDTSFDYGTGFNVAVRGLLVNTSNKIYAIGQFTTYQGSTANRIIRLNADGSKDTSFDYGTGFDADVLGISETPAGNIVITGDFLNYKSYSVQRIIKINNIGDIETTQSIKASFNKDGDGIFKYNTTLTLNELEESEIVNKKLVADYIELNSSKIKLLTADQTTDLITPVNITEFTTLLVADSTYIIRGRLRLGCSGTGGVKLMASTPLSNFGSGSVFGKTSTDELFAISNQNTISPTLPTTPLNNVVSDFGNADFSFIVYTGSGTDVFNLQFASAVASQVSKIFRVGSYMEIIKIQ